MMEKESRETDTLLQNKFKKDQSSGSTMDELDINPFYHRTSWTSYDKIKVGLLSVFLFPLRALLLIVLKTWAALCCFLIMAGVSTKPPITKPITGWRRRTRTILAYIMRCWCKIAGFHNVKVKGRRASFKEAPILVLSPHSTPFDAIAFTYLGAPSLVAKADFQNIPIWNTIVSLSEPVYVFRDDPNSRENTIKEIRRRATSGEDYNQIMIFPEGTCTNRSCLISFKLGAFLPGVPVQPVCIKFPNRMDTVTWAWDGPGLLKMLWLTLTQFHSNFEMELLPVYIPSEEEKKNPRLFADNVRDTMAKALGVPTSNLTFNDCRLITQAKEDKLPFQRGFTAFQKLRSEINIEKSPKEELQFYLNTLPKKQKRMRLKDFTSRLGVSDPTSEIKNLFDLFDRNDDEAMGSIDFREYLVGLHFIATADDSKGRLQLIFKLYDQSQRGFLYQSEFLEGMVHGFNMAPAEALRVYKAAGKLGRSVRDGVTFDMVMNLAEEDGELEEYLKFYHTQLMVNRMKAGEQKHSPEVRRRVGKKLENTGKRLNLSSEEVNHLQDKERQPHKQNECSMKPEISGYIKQEDEPFINGETEHLVNGETQDLINGETEHLINGETEHLNNGETEHLINGETEDIISQEIQYAMNQENECFANQEVENLINQETEDVNTQDVSNQETQVHNKVNIEDSFSLKNGDLVNQAKKNICSQDNEDLIDQINGCASIQEELDRSLNQSQLKRCLSNDHLPKPLEKQSAMKQYELLPKEQEHKHQVKQINLEEKEQLNNGNVFNQENGNGNEGHPTKKIIAKKIKGVGKLHNEQLFEENKSKQGFGDFTVQNHGYLSNGYATREQATQESVYILNGHLPTPQDGHLPNQFDKHLPNGHTIRHTNGQFSHQNDEESSLEHHHQLLVNEEHIKQQNGENSVKDILTAESASLFMDKTSERFHVLNRNIEKTLTENGTCCEHLSAQNDSTSGKLVKRSRCIRENTPTQIFFSLDSFSSQTNESQKRVETQDNSQETSIQKESSSNQEQILQRRHLHSQIGSTDHNKKIT